MTDTKTVLKEMLTENTGRALCDSGGDPSYDAEGRYTGSQYGYGRAFERNQGRDFESEPASVLNAYVYSPQGGDPQAELSVTHSVYHWLSERLDYEVEIDAEFNRFAELPENENTHWLALMEEFPEWRGEQHGHDVSGIYGDGRPMTVNTYNGEDLLSQTLQYTFWSENGESYVLLQIHGGADVRGGYTKPRVFRVMEEVESIFDNARASISCTNDGNSEHNEGQTTIDGSPPNERCHGMWYTDDGYHWYNDDGPTLGEYPTEVGTEGKRGTLVIDEESKRAFCPLCGRSTLASYY